jgi:hypothetical protein
MTNQVEFFKWWFVDERTGKRRLTTYKLSRGHFPERSPTYRPVNFATYREC